MSEENEYESEERKRRENEIREQARIFMDEAEKRQAQQQAQARKIPGTSDTMPLIPHVDRRAFQEASQRLQELNMLENFTLQLFVEIFSGYTLASGINADKAPEKAAEILRYCLAAARRVDQDIQAEHSQIRKQLRAAMEQAGGYS